MSITIDSLWLSVPVTHPGRRRGKVVDEPESISIQVQQDGLWLWDDGCQFQSEVYTMRENRARMFRTVDELPHLDAIYRLAAQERVTHRANMVGAFLGPAVEAMETAIASRDGSSVYFAYAGGHVKIGYSKRVRARLAQLQTGCATPIQLVGTMPGGRAVERRVQAQFDHLRLDGEWFIAHPDLMAYIAEATGVPALAPAGQPS